jgi:hypothetical protein
VAGLYMEVGKAWCQEERGQASTDGLTPCRCEGLFVGERCEGGVGGTLNGPWYEGAREGWAEGDRTKMKKECRRGEGISGGDGGEVVRELERVWQRLVRKGQESSSGNYAGRTRGVSKISSTGERLVRSWVMSGRKGGTKVNGKPSQ